MRAEGAVRGVEALEGRVGARGVRGEAEKGRKEVISSYLRSCHPFMAEIQFSVVPKKLQI